jgi:hypothetical protein
VIALLNQHRRRPCKHILFVVCGEITSDDLGDKPTQFSSGMKAALVAAALVLELVLGSTPSAGCQRSDDCSLNGVCVPTTGECRCNSGWYGNACGLLDLKVSDVGKGAAIHGTNGTWTWGGSAVLDPRTNTWHLYFSYITAGCGLLHYQTNSVVRHATADQLSGPWRVVPGVALGPRSGRWDNGAIHGPTVLHDPSSGLYLLYYMGTSAAAQRPDCYLDPAAMPVMNSSSRRIGLAFSHSLTPDEEEWHRLGDAADYDSGMILSPRPSPNWDSSDVSNAAPVVLQNGSIMLGYRAGGDGVALAGGIGMAYASSWNSSYARKAGHDSMLFAAEDGALWEDHSVDGNDGGLPTYHFLVHRFAAGNGSTVGSAVGGHAYSRDGLTFTLSPDAAYNTTLHLPDGQHKTLYRRERPKPVFANGEGGERKMVALWNGAWPCHKGSEGDDTKDSAAGCESFTVMTTVG